MCVSPRTTLQAARERARLALGVREVVSEDVNGRGFARTCLTGRGRLVGIVTESDLLARLVEGKATLASSVAEVMFRNTTTVGLSDDAAALTDLFARGYVGIVVDEEQRPVGIITKMDLVDHLARKSEQDMAGAAF